MSTTPWLAYRKTSARQRKQSLQSRYVPNGLNWIDPLGISGENVFIYYTNLARLEGIQNTGIIEKHVKAKVYMANIKKSSELEYYHTGKIKLERSQIIHIDKNPYERFNSLNYDKRINMMQNQLKARGCY
jgi:capsid protein